MVQEKDKITIYEIARLALENPDFFDYLTLELDIDGEELNNIQTDLENELKEKHK